MLSLPRSAIDEEEDEGENHHRRSANEHSIHAFHLTPPVRKESLPHRVRSRIARRPVRVRSEFRLSETKGPGTPCGETGPLDLPSSRGTACRAPTEILEQDRPHHIAPVLTSAAG